MTRDEALTEWVVPAIRRTWKEKKCDEILKALEQEPMDVMYYPQVEGITPTVVEPCTDAVSRDAALKCLTGDFWEDADTVLSRCYEKIKYLPSVYPKQRTGRWSHDGSHWKNRWICSECGYKLIDEQTRYCPNCGSFNGGEQNGSTSGTPNP